MTITFSTQYDFWSTGAFLSKFSVYKGTNEIFPTAFSANSTYFLKIKIVIFFCLHVETKNLELEKKKIGSLPYDSGNQGLFFFIYRFISKGCLL